MAKEAATAAAAAAAAAAKEYFGYCIAPNKTATPEFEQLLLGIYGYILKHVAPWDISHLTPPKLAQFYRLVGGNFDRLFLESSPASLSFVFASLGCQHVLHQDKNPFEAPTIPALTGQGFVRWQVIQLLLDPAEHVPFLQEAVKRFEILNSGPGGPFPKILPAECLPASPDVEISKWHEGVGRRLRDQCEPSRHSELSPLKTNFDEADKYRRRPHLNSPHLRSPNSPSSRRQSSSDRPEETRYPNSPHPLRNAKFRRPFVETDSSSSSDSSPGKPPTPERSPRSYSVARNPYAQIRSTDPMGRRHSAHGLAQQPPGVKNTLSPQFYGQVEQPKLGSSTIGQPLKPVKSASVPIPQQLPRRAHRHTVSHDRSREVSWRDKLNAYISETPRDISETREGRHNNGGVRFVDGVGGLPIGPRGSPQRDEWDTDYEGRRRSRRGRRPSGG